MDRRISATKTARTFSEILDRVLHDGDVFVVERRGIPVCRIIPAGASRATVKDLVRVLKAALRPDAEYLDTVKKLAKRQPPLPKSKLPR